MKLFVFFCIPFFIYASELSEMQKACDNNSVDACYELGELYSGADGLKQDKEKMKKYLNKACQLGKDKACEKLDIY